MMNSVYYSSLDDVAEVGDGSLMDKGSVNGNDKTRILTWHHIPPITGLRVALLLLGSMKGIPFS